MTCHEPTSCNMSRDRDTRRQEQNIFSHTCTLTAAPFALARLKYQAALTKPINSSDLVVSHRRWAAGNVSQPTSHVPLVLIEPLSFFILHSCGESFVTLFRSDPVLFWFACPSCPTRSLRPCCVSHTMKGRDSEHLMICCMSTDVPRLPRMKGSFCTNQEKKNLFFSDQTLQGASHKKKTGP